MSFGEKKIEEAVKGKERLQEESRMFKVAKMLNCKSFESIYEYGKNGNQVSNSEEIYKKIKDHFKYNFYEASINYNPRLLGSSNLDKWITTEVRQATLNFTNNRAAGPDRISAEFIKYAHIEVHVFINELLNYGLENHNMLDISRGSLCPLYKPGKPKRSVKNLRLVIETMLKNIISIILLCEPKVRRIPTSIPTCIQIIVVQVMLHVPNGGYLRKLKTKRPRCI